MEQAILPNLRPDNFAIDLTSLDIANWTKQQYRAFAKLLVKFSNTAAEHIKILQNKKENITKEVQLIWLKLPERDESNKKAINKINQVLSNHGFMDRTGNEPGTTLLCYLNAGRPCPIPRLPRVALSVSVVIVTETDKVLLLQRGGLSGRAGTWGTLTGKIEWSETKESTLAREVHEEINMLLADYPAHYVGSLHTPGLGRDLVEKGKAISWSDDCSYVYGIRIPEEILQANILLDDENSAWKLFTREELNFNFSKVHTVAIHGLEFDKKETHVARAKALLVLDAASNNFENIKLGKFTYPYTNSHGFFAHFKSGKTSPETSDLSFEASDTTVSL